MNTLRFRALVSKYGNCGYVFAAFVLLALALRRRCRLANLRRVFTLLVCLSLLLCGKLVKSRLFLGCHFSQPAVLPYSPVYKIIELDALPRDSASSAFAINSVGSVVGRSSFRQTNGQQPADHPVLWQDGRAFDLGTLGGSVGYAAGINDRHQVVGASTASDGNSYAFLWQKGKMQNLGSMGDKYKSSWAAHINDQGVIVGSTTRPGTYSSEAFLWKGGQMRLLDAVARGESSSAIAVTSKEEVTGTISLNWLYCSAYLYKDGKVEYVPILADGLGNWARGINASGWIVGFSDVDDSLERHHAFRWRSGQAQAQDLGTLGGNSSEAEGINDRGDIVGDAQSANGQTHAVLWQNDKIISLESCICQGEEWKLSTASGINNKGQIVGTGVHNGRTRAYLLTPM